MIQKGMRRFLVFAVAVCFLAGASAQAQDLPPELAARLVKERLIQVFQTRPKNLSLLPAFPGADDFRARHAGLKPHIVQEGLFLMPPALARAGMDTVLAVMRDALSLSGLAFFPETAINLQEQGANLSEPGINPQEQSAKPIPLFGKVSFVSPPVDLSTGNESSFAYTLKVDDKDFGRCRFDVMVSSSGKIALFRMVNLDSLHYWILPAVPPGQAFIDLVYFADAERGGMLYAAWSVRALLYVPGVVDVRTPIERRAFALRDWFLKRVEQELETTRARS